MKPYLTFLLIAFLIALTLGTSCKGRRSGAGGGADSLASTEITYPFTIDVSEEYPMEPISLQEVFGEMEYVALETSPECLIDDLPGLHSPVVTDNDIFILSGHNPIFHFARDGKFIKRIGSQGRGPGEFLAAGGIWVNDRTKEIFLYDIYGKGLLVYGYDGKHKRTLRTNSNSSVDDLVALTDSTLLVAYGHDPERKSVDAFQLISSRNGQVVKTVLPACENPQALVQTDIKPPQRGMVSYWAIPETDNDPAKWYKGVAGGVGLSLRYDQSYGILSEEHNVYVTAAGVELTSLVADTVYMVSATGDLTPRWIKTPSPMKVDVPGRRYSKLGLETERYAFFSAVGAGETSGYVVDKSNGAVSRAYLYDANVDHLQTHFNRIIFPTAVSKGRLAMPYQPLHLLQWLEEGKLSGELATLTSTLKETDNPVLLISK
jgi:hypothetical protein